MKLLFVNTLYYPNVIGGAERVTQILAESLVQDGHEVVVVSTSPNRGKQVDFVNGVKVYYLELKNLYWQFKGEENQSNLKPLWHTLDSYNPWMAEEVAKILDVEQPNLVHTNNLGGFSVRVWQAVKKRSLPLVHTLHDYHLICVRSAMFYRGKNCEAPCWHCQPYSLPRRYFSKLPDAVVGVSKFLLDRHLKLGYFRHTPIHQTIFNACRHTAISTCQRDSPTGLLRIGYLGRLQVEKGIEFLLSALKSLPNQSWELWIGGQGKTEYEAYLKNFYTSPNIHYLGFIQSEELFSKIDVLVVPSLWQEPLGVVVCEAYAYKVPVISSNRGGIPEMIDEGKTGFIFDPDKPESLINIFSSIMNNTNTLARMQQNCLEKARTFEPKQVAQKYLNLYQKLMHISYCRLS